MLECNLIKEHRPRYNTMLKDDKTYPYIKVTVSEEYPRILFSRTMKKDKNKYFGPFTSSVKVKDTIDLLHRIYRIRTCTRNLPRDIGKEQPACTTILNSAIPRARDIFQKRITRNRSVARWIFWEGNMRL